MQREMRLEDGGMALSEKNPEHEEDSFPLCVLV